MLNISEHSVSKAVHKLGLKTLKRVEERKSSRVLLRLVGGTFILGLIIMFIPWTQNIRSHGNVTTISPDQRPQTIHSVIPGRIEKWYVKEGDHVKKGDTIAFISEIKPEYFDEKLLERTQQQTDYKKLSVTSYEEKVNALDQQVNALATQRDLKLNQGQIKLKQAQLNVTNDSIALNAARVNYETAQEQYERMLSLYEQGLKSKTDLENRNVKVQDSYSKYVEAQNKYLASQAELLAVKIELSNIKMKYRTDIAKAQSEKYSALSGKLDSEGEVTKLENQFANYQKRNNFYYILAPQDCYITQLIANGIGETVKEGAPILKIMPTNYTLAVEMYVDPLDLPLLRVGEHVRLQFDGWPAVVFSGWPNVSYGTYGGRIYAIDQYISDNGKFRVLVEQDPNDHPWPDALRYGGGANAMILLDDVPIWYELWRKINGFPPNYYKEVEKDKKTDKEPH
ncbi:MAG: HlyD family efflux transporter periplasmic adaptor subunit [Crocinitomicaceae bacterium]|nr:HlyD family efflux transporter periplasmic adaptor subunit [Crocinitomicaceae bacterium]